MIVTGIIHIVLLLSCNGQLEGIPQLQELIRPLTKNPFLQSIAGTSSDFLADSVELVSHIPIAIARALTPLDVWPVLVSHRNVVDLTDRFVKELDLGSKNEDAALNITELISKYGYPVETHDVVTEDGYVLRMFRIPGNGSVLFLMHGLLGSADDFVVAGVESGLAYQLSRGGYDVWLGNARGNKHSRRHTHLRPLDSKFWDFTWHEIGLYDLPAMIDYAFEKSGSTTLKYIGHSQGTTSFFVMASERPEYNEKISLMVALSPVAFMSHVRSPIIRLLASEGPLLYTISNGIGINEFLPDNKLVKTLKSLLCSVGVMSEILCNNLLFLIVGFDLEQLNVTNLPVLFGHVPSGSSAKQLAHYGQLIISDEFRKYDYGTPGNLRRYGKTFPPRYNLRRISTPVSLFYSDADWLAHPADVRRLLHELGNVVDVYKIPYKYFNHLDFLFSKDCKILIYERLRKVLQSF